MLQALKFKNLAAIAIPGIRNSTLSIYEEVLLNFVSK
jgi:hypothetical protein